MRSLNGGRSLIILSGLPATGKSYLAERIAEATGALLVGADTIREALCPLHLWGREVKYSREVSEMVYQLVFYLAEMGFKAGMTVILNGTFLRRGHRRRAVEIARDCGARVIFIRTYCTEEEALARLRDRDKGTGKDFSDADEEVYVMMKRKLEKGDPAYSEAIEDDILAKEDIPLIQYDSERERVEGVVARVSRLCRG